MFQAIVTRVFIILLQRSLIDLHLLRTPRELRQVLSMSWACFRKGFSFPSLWVFSARVRRRVKKMKARIIREIGD